jgi:SWI/SNF-related matrix-associated actin-dependent regulator of chromatin subfamily D
LRIFVSNLASDQPAQLGDQDMQDIDDANNLKAPSWTLRVEGRLLDVSYFMDNMLTLAL